MKKISILFGFIFLLSAPFTGLFAGLSEFSKTLEYKGHEIENLQNLNVQAASISENYDAAIEKSEHIESVVEQYVDTFAGQSVTIEAQIERSIGQQELSDDIYERKITAVLGEPVSTYRSPQVEIKLFELKELDYRGYMAKIKLFDPNAFQVVLAEDEIGGFETTSSIAKRTRAMLAINGGGFGTSRNEKELISSMIGGTVVNGEVVQPFIVKNEPLFFAGIDHDGRVVGTVPSSQGDVDALNPKDGVSFVPVLLQSGTKVKLPGAWANTKHPRTILGRYANDDLLLIVIDGRQAYWSKGVTLERVQDKLQELGVQDAYNLDGGGSSTIYFNGHVLNKPSDGNERPVANAIIIKP